MRRAGERYQGSFRGRVCHAERQSRYRARERQKVTHQGFAAGVSSDSVDLGNETKEVDDDKSSAERLLVRFPTPAEGGEHRESAEHRDRRAKRCSWCGAEGRRFVRFGYWRR
jgi:hypothetical protein